MSAVDAEQNWTEADDYDEDAESDEWQPGDCDYCYGGDENGVTATGALGPIYCACRIGQGAYGEACRCGPPAEISGGGTDG